MMLVKVLMTDSVVTNSKSIRILPVMLYRVGELISLLHLVLIRGLKESGISMSLMLVGGAQSTEEEVTSAFRVMLRTYSLDLALLALNIEVFKQIMQE